MITALRSLFFLAVAALAFGPNAVASEVRAVEVRAIKLSASGKLEAFTSFRTGQDKPADQIVAARVALDIDGVSVPPGQLSLKPASDSDSGLAVLIAVDVSGSVSEGLPLIKQALKQYVRQLRPGKDFVSVGAIADNWQPVSDYSSDMDQAVSAIDGLGGQSKTTALFESVYEGVRTLALRGQDVPPRRLMIVVSDGMNEKAGRTVAQCIEIARQNLIQVHSLIFLPRQSARVLAAKGDMEMLSRDTGAQTFTATDAGQIATAVQRFREDIVQETVIEIAASTLPTDGREHTLGIRYDSGLAKVSFMAALPDVSKKSGVQAPVTQAGLASMLAPFSDSRWLIAAIATAGLMLIGLATYVVRARRSGEAALASSEMDLAFKADDVKDQALHGHEQSATSAGVSEALIPIPILDGSDPPQQEKSAALHRRKTEYRPQGAERGVHRLLVLQGYPSLNVIDLPNRDVFMGAHPQNDVVIDVPSVSGRHAVLSKSLHGLSVKDLGSTNGTFVDGVRVGAEPVALSRGQQLRLGPVVLRAD